MTQRRKEPWEEYPVLHRRLSEWSDWLHGQYQTLGWNVYQGDQEPRLKVQTRNDLHGDQVYHEVANMDADYRRNLETDDAYRELPDSQRHIIWLLYVERVAYPKATIAQKTGIHEVNVARSMRRAFRNLDEAIKSRRHVMFNAA